MRIGRLFCLVFAGSALAYACSTFGEEPVDPGDGGAGGDAGGGGDAALDAPGDGSPGPDGAVSDAGNDGPDTGVYFFDDFDDGGRSPSWVSFFNPSGSDAGDMIIEATGRSAPNAYHVDNRGTPFYGGMQWSWPAAGNQTRVLVSVDVNVVKRPTGNAYIVMNVIDGNTAHDKDDHPAPVLVVSPDLNDITRARLSAFNLVSSTSDGAGEILATVPLGTWRRVEMGYEPVAGDPTSWKVTWVVEGGAPFKRVVAAPPSISPGRTTFLGIQTGDALADVRFDNVKIDLR